MSDATISKLMNLYSKFVLEYGISPKELVESGGWSVISEALPVIHSKSDALHWLGEAKVLSLRDMRISVQEARTGISTTECEHTHRFTISVCEDCGDKIRIYE